MLSLLDTLLTMAGLLVLVPAGYLGFLTVLSGRLRPPPAAQKKWRFDIIVPAHNEAAGITRTVKNLLALEWPKDDLRVLVVADNCQDDTAALARAAGAIALERHSDTHKGKGYALDFAFKQSLADARADAVVVVDADTVVSPNLLAAFAARLEQGARAAQAHYSVLEENASWRTRLMRVAFEIFHGVRSLGRERLGVSCGLRGNGMCFSKETIAAIPHDAFSVVEDVEYGIRLGRAGIPVRYVHEARVLGEMVAAEQASRSQRTRWAGGRLGLMKKYGLPLVVESIQKLSFTLFDLAMDVLIPPLTWVVVAAGGGFAFTQALVFFTDAHWAAEAPFFVSCLCLLAYVFRGWMLSGTGVQGLLDLAWAPVYMVWKMALMVRGNSRPTDWVRTARAGEAPEAAAPKTGEPK